MFLSRILLALPVAVALSACGGSDPATRAALTVSPSQAGGASSRPDASGTVVMQSQYQVMNVNIAVPQSLKVSEANSFVPHADIVWRGEARGDRHAQVSAIFRDAANAATAGMTEGRPVNVTLEVTRFHMLTEKARYTTGGNMAMHFLLTVTDAATGQVIDGPRPVVADFHGAGGAKAIAEEEAGLTQRVVSVQRLTDVLRRELSAVVTDPQLVSRALMGTQVMPVGTN
jgi:hypothetical protein